MALFYKQQADGGVLAVWKIEETEQELLDLFPLPSRLRHAAEAARFASAARRLEWLSARALLLALLGEDKPVAYRPDGKPCLADGSWQVSISHTAGYAAVLLDKERAVGIDIERYASRVRRVARRFMRPDERALPYCGDDVWGMLLHWSGKESVYKCMEHPHPDLRLLRVLPFEPQRTGSFAVQSCVDGRLDSFLVSYLIADDHVLTWTVQP